MTCRKWLIASLLTLGLSMPAFAGTCYDKKERGDGESTAGAVMITYKNKSGGPLATYVQGLDGEKERIWLEDGEKTKRRFNIRRSGPDIEGVRSPRVDNGFQLTYSPWASEVELLFFNIENQRQLGVGGAHKTTTYSTTISKRKDISCTRSFRPNKERWDLNIEFK